MKRIILIFALLAPCTYAQRYINAADVNVRDYPSVDGTNILKVLQMLDAVDVLMCGDNWCAIDLSDGGEKRVGYVSKRYLSQSVSSSLSEPTVSYTPSRSYTPTRRSVASRNYITGPRGGCYYINSNGKKTYVSRSLCN